MAKIVLINPPYSLERKRETGVLNYPMGILCVATALRRAGHEVILFECAYEDDYNRKVVEACQGALFAGFSVMTSQVGCALETAEILRHHQPSLPLVWGGVHPTLEPKATVASPFCDIVVVGEADHSVVSLARSLAGGGCMDGVQGILFKRRGEVVITEPASAVTDLDALPVDYSFVDVDRYLDLDVDKLFGFFPNIPGSVRRLTLHSARGCPYSCGFCINSLVRGQESGVKRYRAMSSGFLIEEIVRLKSMYNLNFISFGDDLFFANPKRTREVVDRLIELDLGIKWYANVRADFFREDYINHEFLARLEQAGCIRFALGAESGSERVLRYLDKQLSPLAVMRSAKAIDAFNFVAGYSFMVGLPGEEEEDVYRTMALTLMIKKLSRRSYIIGPQMYRPYPGSKLFLDCVALGWKAPVHLEDWATGLELSGHFPLEQMGWVKNKALALEACDFVHVLMPKGQAEDYLRERAGHVLDEFEEMRASLTEGKQT